MQRVQTLLDPCHQRLVVSVEHGEPVAHGARGEHIDIGARKAFPVDERRGYATHVARLERLRQVQHLLLERRALAIERQELLPRRHRLCVHHDSTLQAPLGVFVVAHLRSA